MSLDSTEISGFDLVTGVVCGASLCGSVPTGWEIIGSIRPGFYGGTALLIALLVFAQIAALVLAVGLPAVVLLLGRRLRMSRFGWWLLAAALVAIVGEALGLVFIPVTENC